MFPIRLLHKVSERLSRKLRGSSAAATCLVESGRARSLAPQRAAAASYRHPVRFGTLVLAATLTLTACSTVEDGWDAITGGGDSEDANVPDGLQGVSQPPEYSNGTGARRAPTEQYALNEQPQEAPAQQAAPAKAAPVEQTAKTAPAPKVEKTPQTVPAPQQLAPATPVVQAPAPIPQYIPPAPDEETTTVISGNGRVNVQRYSSAPSYGSATQSHSVVNTGGLAMGLGMTGPGPYALEAYNNAGTSVSTLVATIQFADGSASLSGHDQAILRQVVALQKQHGGVLRVIGHASSRTDNMSWNRHDQANLKVSQGRARSVMRSLMELGATKSALYVGAAADNEPIYQEAMPSGEAGNRRTEIYLDY